MADLIELLRSALAERYRIDRPLGAGGMAVVYLAEDLRHHRRVALKVLRPEIAAEIGNDRFLREIETAGRLTHPHIVPLHESGETGGFLYYVMPYVEGESLRDRLDREKQLPLADALQIAREVADALSYAHGHDVIHRDIKPENILLQSRHAMVADFGIARAVTIAGGTRTPTGMALGTPAYMSPEQALGSRDVDARSDLYSLACVLYEMLAGQPPFTGPSGESLVHQHLSAEPPAITQIRPGVPESIARALSQALAKTPADRFPTAVQLVEALNAPAPTPSRPQGEAKPVRRVLIMTGTVIAVAALALIGWNALFQAGHRAGESPRDWVLVAAFEGPAMDSSLVAATRDLMVAALEQSEIVAAVPPEQVRIALERAGKPTTTRVDNEVARELAYRSAVRAVLEGRVGRLGEGYSIVLRLVDADSAKVLASLSEAARDEDALIPAVGRIARKLRAELGERRTALQATRPLDQAMTPSFEAYRRYVRALQLTRSADDRGAIAVAQSAIALDPDFAEAWSLVATSFTNINEPDSALEAYARTLAHPERVTWERRTFCEAQMATLRGDNLTALSLYEKLVQLRPDSPGGRSNLGLCLGRAGRWEEAVESYRAAEGMSPFGPFSFVLNNHINALLVLGRTEEAKRMVPGLPGDLREEFPIRIAIMESAWETAESLATATRSNPSTSRGNRLLAGLYLASIQASRGRIRACDRTLREVQALAGSLTGVNRARRLSVLLPLVAPEAEVDLGEFTSSDSTTAGLLTQGLWAAAKGDTTSARRMLARVRRRSAADLARQGSSPELLEGWIAASSGRWPDVVRILGPAALQSQSNRYTLLESLIAVRWLVAEAYEELGRADSAAAYFERVVRPYGSYSRDAASAVASRAMAQSYAHRRLALLYARMGRPQEARRHWEIFSATVTHPDPEVLALVEETRAAIATMGAMTATGGQ